MKRLWLAVMLVLTLGFGTVTVMAQEPGTHPKHITDDAKLLSYTEVSDLETKAEKIAGQYGMDIAVVTRESIYGADAQKAADDIFDIEGYGTGEEKDGILLLVSMKERDWSLTTHGAAIDLFTDYRLDEISGRVLTYLSEDEYYDAFDTYLHDVEFYLQDNGTKSSEGLQESTAAPEAAKSGNSVTGADGALKGSMTEAAEQETAAPEKEVNPWLNMAKMSVTVGIIVTAIYIAVQMSRMKNVRRQEQADGYMKKESYELTKKQDIFLYSRTVEREIKKEDPRRTNPGQGNRYDRSTTHVSSSGERHGGKKGKF